MAKRGSDKVGYVKLNSYTQRSLEGAYKSNSGGGRAASVDGELRQEQVGRRRQARLQRHGHAAVERHGRVERAAEARERYVSLEHIYVYFTKHFY